MEGSIITKLYNLISKQRTSLQALTNKAKDFQEELKSGVNIKTINGESILGKGDLEIAGDGGVAKSYVDTSINTLKNTLSYTIDEVSTRLANNVNAGGSVTKVYVDSSIDSLKSYVDEDSLRWPAWFKEYNTDQLRPEITTLSTSVSTVYDATNYEVSSRITDISTYVANMYNTDVQITYTADTKTLNFTTTTVMPVISYPVVIVGGEHVTCGNKNTVTSEKSSYTNKLTAQSGYSIKSVKVYVAGIDHTGDYYKASTTTVSISSGKVAGTIVIVIEEQPESYVITFSGSHCTRSNQTTSVMAGDSYSNTIQTNSRYVISDVIVSMGGVNITKDVCDISTSRTSVAIDIASVSGDIIIQITTGEKSSAPTYSVVYSGSGYSKSNESLQAEQGSTYDVTIEAADGFTLTSITASMEGAGTITVSGGTVHTDYVTGKITIVVVTTAITYSITWDGSYGTKYNSSSGQTNKIAYGSTFSTTLSALTDYQLDSVSIIMGSSEISGNAGVCVKQADGTYTLSILATDNITITVTASVVQTTSYTVTWDGDTTKCNIYSTGGNTVTGGMSFGASVSEIEGYSITSVVVKMGGNTLTDAYTKADGSIYISAVTGNIVITITAQTKEYVECEVVWYNVANYTISDSNAYTTVAATNSMKTTIEAGEQYSNIILPTSGYRCVSANVVMGGETYTDMFNPMECQLTIPSVTGDATISVTTEENPVTTYTIYFEGYNYNNAGTTMTMQSNSRCYFSLIANDDYKIDQAVITIGGVDITKWAYNKKSDVRCDISLGYPNDNVYIMVDTTYTGDTYSLNWSAGAYQVVSSNSKDTPSPIHSGDYTGYILSNNDGVCIEDVAVTRNNSGGTTVNSTYTTIIDGINGNGILTIPDVSYNLYINTSLTTYTPAGNTYTIKVTGDTDYLYYNQPEAETNPLETYLDGTATDKEGGNMYIPLMPKAGHILKNVTVSMSNGNDNCWKLFDDNDRNLFITYLAGNTTIDVTID